MISEKNACSFKELKNKVILRSFCSVWFWPIRIETFPQVFLQVLSHFWATLLQPTKFASITNSNEHREYFTINLGTTRDDAMVSKKCVCSFEELKNKAILRSFCSVWFWPSESRYFLKYFFKSYPIFPICWQCSSPQQKPW